MIIFVIMAGNIFGEIFRLISFGESHGSAIGGVVEGCPAGLLIDQTYIQEELRRRKPGSRSTSSARKENDRIEILSGIYKGKSLGTPIAFHIFNEDQRPADYQSTQEIFRPSHADYAIQQKYGTRDPRGGGRSSGRETAVRVAGGAIAKLLLKSYRISINAYTVQIGPHTLEKPHEKIGEELFDNSVLYCPDEPLTKKMISYLKILGRKGDTTGGMVLCLVKGVPPGLGEPVFDKLHADLGKAILSIGACKGFEIGNGFAASGMKGSEHNDPFIVSNKQVRTTTNHSGGVQGGISNGMDIWFRAAFKPVPSIHLPQQTINSKGKGVEITLSGRHDVCVIPRVIPVVEAMTALVLADHLLRNRNSQV